MKKFFLFFFLFLNFSFLRVFSYSNDISYLESANFLAENDIIVDRSENTDLYNLDSGILRQEIAWIIAKITAIPSKDICENIFTDLSKNKPNDWACMRVESLLEVWIIAKNTKYRPESFISKAEAIWLIVKSLYLYEYNKYYDEKKSWQENAVNFSIKKWILKENIWNYNDLASRWFIFRIIYYALKNIEKSTYHWEFCQNPKFDFWFSSWENVNKELQCLYLEVPLDYSNPNSEKINIALTMQLAKKLNPKNLVVIMWWPWQSGIDFSNKFLAETKYTKKLLEEFNIIWYSPRWIFPSSPQINCWKNIEKLSPKEIAENCSENIWINVLKHLWSNQAAEDLEWIRKSLWSDNLSFLAFSYWTKILSLYSEKYPDRVKAWVFDWVVDVKENMFEIYSWQEKWFQKSFENFVKYCLKYEWCYFKEEKWDYNFQFHKFLNFVDENDFFDFSWKKIKSEYVLSIIQENLIWWESYWMNIIGLLEGMNNKKTEVYNSLYWDLFEINHDITSEIDDLSLEVINCLDFAPELKNRDKLKYISEMKKIDNFSLYDNHKTKKEEDYLDLCFYFPFSWNDKFEIPNISKNLSQMLFVWQTFDPTTPYQNTLNMAKYFHNSTILTRNKDGHVISFTWESECVDEFVFNYLSKPEKKLSNKICD